MDGERVLWVTGGGSGTGRASAEVAAARGWRVALTGRRAEALGETAERVRAAGGVAIAVPGDAGDPDDVTAGRDRILGEWGRIDGLVLAAGRNAPRRTWADQTTAEVAEIVRTNLLGVVLTIDAALPALRAHGGTVVVVSSLSAWRFSPQAGVAYAASKTALGPLVQTLNEQEAAHGVRATHLCPGDIDSDFLAQRPEVPDASARARMLSPGDVAEAVRFVLESPPHVRIDELVLTPVR